MSTADHSQPPSKAGPKLPPYGLALTLAQAKKVAAAALAPAHANNWTMVIAIVDPGGHLVYLEKMDQTQVGSVAIAASQARSSALSA
jgi:glc operon protein GlcG